MEFERQGLLRNYQHGVSMNNDQTILWIICTKRRIEYISFFLCVRKNEYIVWTNRWVESTSTTWIKFSSVVAIVNKLCCLCPICQELVYCIQFPSVHYIRS